MTPAEKAKELLWKYLPILEGWKEEDSNKAKECALIAVGEIMRMPNIGYNHNEDESQYDYWQEVKQELQKL